METIKLVIEEVPDVDTVKDEILDNANAIIRNYWARELLKPASDKQAEFDAKMATVEEKNITTAKATAKATAEATAEVKEPVQ